MRFRYIIIIIVLIIILYILKSSKSEKKNKITVKLYYANWCGYSKKFLPEWTKFKKLVKGNKKIETETIKCEGDKESMCKKVGIIGYPTIRIELKDSYKDYNGKRESNSLLKYCEKII